MDQQPLEQERELLFVPQRVIETHFAVASDEEQHRSDAAIMRMQVRREGHLDEVEVRCELRPEGAAAAPVNEIAAWVQQRIKTLVGISTVVSVLPPDAIERKLTGKARRVFDQRAKAR